MPQLRPSCCEPVSHTPWTNSICRCAILVQASTYLRLYTISNKGADPKRDQPHTVPQGWYQDRLGHEVFVLPSVQTGAPWSSKGDLILVKPIFFQVPRDRHFSGSEDLCPCPLHLQPWYRLIFVTTGNSILGCLGFRKEPDFRHIIAFDSFFSSM